MGCSHPWAPGALDLFPPQLLISGWQENQWQSQVGIWGDWLVVPSARLRLPGSWDDH